MTSVYLHHPGQRTPHSFMLINYREMRALKMPTELLFIAAFGRAEGAVSGTARSIGGDTTALANERHVVPRLCPNTRYPQDER
jgi:hypothetical protein